MPTEEVAADPAPTSHSWVIVAIAWTLVGIPLLWGIYNTFKKAIVLLQ